MVELERRVETTRVEHQVEQAEAAMRRLSAVPSITIPGQRAENAIQRAEVAISGTNAAANLVRLQVGHPPQVQSFPEQLGAAVEGAAALMNSDNESARQRGENIVRAAVFYSQNSSTLNSAEGQHVKVQLINYADAQLHGRTPEATFESITHGLDSVSRTREPNLVQSLTHEREWVQELFTEDELSPMHAQMQRLINDLDSAVRTLESGGSIGRLDIRQLARRVLAVNQSLEIVASIENAGGREAASALLNAGLNALENSGQENHVFEIASFAAVQAGITLTNRSEYSHRLTEAASALSNANTPAEVSQADARILSIIGTQMHEILNNAIRNSPINGVNAVEAIGREEVSRLAQMAASISTTPTSPTAYTDIVACSNGISVLSRLNGFLTSQDGLRRVQEIVPIFQRAFASLSQDALRASNGASAELALAQEALAERLIGSNDPGQRRLIETLSSYLSLQAPSLARANVEVFNQFLILEQETTVPSNTPPALREAGLHAIRCAQEFLVRTGLPISAEDLTIQRNNLAAEISSNPQTHAQLSAFANAANLTQEQMLGRLVRRNAVEAVLDGIPQILTQISHIEAPDRFVPIAIAAIERFSHGDIQQGGLFSDSITLSQLFHNSEDQQLVVNTTQDLNAGRITSAQARLAFAALEQLGRFGQDSQDPAVRRYFTQAIDAGRASNASFDNILDAAVSYARNSAPAQGLTQRQRRERQQAVTQARATLENPQTQPQITAQSLAADDTDFQHHVSSFYGRTRDSEARFTTLQNRERERLERSAGDARHRGLVEVVRAATAEAALCDPAFIHDSLQEAVELHMQGTQDLQRAVELNTRAESATGQEAQTLHNQARDLARQGQIRIDASVRALEALRAFETSFRLNTIHRTQGRAQLVENIRNFLAIGSAETTTDQAEAALVQTTQATRSAAQLVRRQQTIEHARDQGIHQATLRLHIRNLETARELITPLLRYAPDQNAYAEILRTALSDSGNVQDHIQMLQAMFSELSIRRMLAIPQGQAGHVDNTERLEFQHALDSHDQNQLEQLYHRLGARITFGGEGGTYNPVANEQRYHQVVAAYRRERIPQATRELGTSVLAMNQEVAISRNLTTQISHNEELYATTGGHGPAYGQYRGSVELIDSSDATFQEILDHVPLADRDRLSRLVHGRLEEINSLPQEQQGAPRAQLQRELPQDVVQRTFAGTYEYTGRALDHRLREAHTDADLSATLIEMQHADVAQTQDTWRASMRYRACEIGYARQQDHGHYIVPVIGTQDQQRASRQHNGDVEGISAARDETYARGIEDFNAGADALIRARDSRGDSLVQVNSDTAYQLVSSLPQEIRNQRLANGHTYTEMLEEMQHASPDQREQLARNLFVELSAHSTALASGAPPLGISLGHGQFTESERLQIAAQGAMIGANQREGNREEMRRYSEYPADLALQLLNLTRSNRNNDEGMAQARAGSVLNIAQRSLEQSNDADFTESLQAGTRVRGVIGGQGGWAGALRLANRQFAQELLPYTAAAHYTREGLRIFVGESGEDIDQSVSHPHLEQVRREYLQQADAFSILQFARLGFDIQESGDQFVLRAANRSAEETQRVEDAYQRVAQLRQNETAELANITRSDSGQVNHQLEYLNLTTGRILALQRASSAAEFAQATEGLTIVDGHFEDRDSRLIEARDGARRMNDINSASMMAFQFIGSTVAFGAGGFVAIGAGLHAGHDALTRAGEYADQHGGFENMTAGQREWLGVQIGLAGISAFIPMGGELATTERATTELATQNVGRLRYLLWGAPELSGGQRALHLMGTGQMLVGTGQAIAEFPETLEQYRQGRIGIFTLGMTTFQGVMAPLQMYIQASRGQLTAREEMLGGSLSYIPAPLRAVGEMVLGTPLEMQHAIEAGVAYHRALREVPQERLPTIRRIETVLGRGLGAQEIGVASELLGYNNTPEQVARTIGAAPRADALMQIFRNARGESTPTREELASIYNLEPAEAETIHELLEHNASNQSAQTRLQNLAESLEARSNLHLALSWAIAQTASDLDPAERVQVQQAFEIFEASGGQATAQELGVSGGVHERFVQSRNIYERHSANTAQESQGSEILASRIVRAFRAEAAQSWETAGQGRVVPGAAEAMARNNIQPSEELVSVLRALDMIATSQTGRDVEANGLRPDGSVGSSSEIRVPPEFVLEVRRIAAIRSLRTSITQEEYTDALVGSARDIVNRRHNQEVASRRENPIVHMPESEPESELTARRDEPTARQRPVDPLAALRRAVEERRHDISINNSTTAERSSVEQSTQRPSFVRRATTHFWTEFSELINGTEGSFSPHVLIPGTAPASLMPKYDIFHPDAARHLSINFLENTLNPRVRSIVEAQAREVVAQPDSASAWERLAAVHEIPFMDEALVRNAQRLGLDPSSPEMQDVLRVARALDVIVNSAYGRNIESGLSPTDLSLNLPSEFAGPLAQLSQGLTARQRSQRNHRTQSPETTAYLDSLSEAATELYHIRQHGTAATELRDVAEAWVSGDHARMEAARHVVQGDWAYRSEGQQLYAAFGRLVGQREFTGGTPEARMRLAMREVQKAVQRSSEGDTLVTGARSTATTPASAQSEQTPEQIFGGQAIDEFRRLRMAVSVEQNGALRIITTQDGTPQVEFTFEQTPSNPSTVHFDLPHDAESLALIQQQLALVAHARDLNTLAHDYITSPHPTLQGNSNERSIAWTLAQDPRYQQAIAAGNSQAAFEVARAYAPVLYRAEYLQSRITYNGNHVQVVQGARQIIAIGDVHGDSIGLVDQLVLSGVLIDTVGPSGNQSTPLSQRYRLNPELPRGTQVVFTGDYMDRGSRSVEVVQVVQQMQTDAAARTDGVMVHSIRGNHEELFIDFVGRYQTTQDAQAALADSANHWRRIGMANTFNSVVSHYGSWENFRRANIDPNGHPIPGSMMDFIQKTPGVVVIDNNYFTHGGPVIGTQNEHGQTVPINNVGDLDRHFARVFSDPHNSWRVTNMNNPSYVGAGRVGDYSAYYSKHWRRLVENNGELDRWMQRIGVDHIYVGHERGDEVRVLSPRVTNIDTGMSEGYNRGSGILFIDPLNVDPVRVSVARHGGATLDGEQVPDRGLAPGEQFVNQTGNRSRETVLNNELSAEMRIARNESTPAQIK